MEFIEAKIENFEELVALRIKAMKPSLENIGRFDPIRSRERFQNSFVPEDTIIIVDNDKLIGFYMLSTIKNGLFLNHFYIDPSFQGNGLGSKILQRIKESANGKKIELEALKESRSNNFYESNGFIKVGESEFDNLYTWCAATKN